MGADRGACYALYSGKWAQAEQLWALPGDSKKLNPEVKTFAVEPAEVLHRSLRGSNILGLSIVPGIYNSKGFDGTMFVSTEKSYAMMESMVEGGRHIYRTFRRSGGFCGC